MMRTATSARSLDLKLRRRSMLSSIGCSRSALERSVEMAPAKADVSIPVDDQCPALLGDNFPQHELGCENVPSIEVHISERRLNDDPDHGSHWKQRSLAYQTAGWQHGARSRDGAKTP